MNASSIASRLSVTGSAAVGKSGQLNIRTDPATRADLVTIQREHGISDRSNAARLAIRREAQRIRRKMRSTTK